MICLNCANLTTRPRSPDPRAATAAKTMADNCFGTCQKQPAFVFVSPTRERDCKMFAPAPEGQMAARRKWVMPTNCVTPTDCVTGESGEAPEK